MGFLSSILKYEEMLVIPCGYTRCIDQCIEQTANRPSTSDNI